MLVKLLSLISGAAATSIVTVATLLWFWPSLARYVKLSRPRDRHVRILLKPKGSESLESLAGEFANELLNQVMRQRVGHENRAVREQYLAKSFGATRKNPTIAELLAELDDEELADESLEIPVPWAGNQKE